jgi:hypothetical protein
MPDALTKLDTMLQVGRAFGMRDGMRRLRYEFQRGSGLMSWKMRSVQGWDSWQLDRIAPKATAEEFLVTRRNGSSMFFFSDARTLGAEISGIIGPEGKARVLAEAENILSGNFPYFGALSFAAGFPPRWFHNPVTGQSVSPLRLWTQMRFASPAYGDLKFILEPSRFLFVYPLARAYALSGDDRYPEAFWNCIEDWVRNNPPMAGPLWICGQESSLRILSWSFALDAFIHSSSTTSGRVALLIAMIAAHAWRTAQTLGYARSQRSNHLMSEAVGLWTAGTLFPELREAQLWQILGAQLLHEAALDQITPDGASQQHSFNYHRMILHQLLWALRLSEINHAPLHNDIRTRAQAASEFIREWVDPVSGFAPHYGSDDGSLIFPLASASYQDFRPLVQLSSAILQRPSLPPGPWDEAAVWFGAKPALVEESIPVSTPSADTGYFRLGDDTSWALIRAGKYSRRPFQADQLHVDLWWKGINLARDPGTYLYNGSAPWNNGFAKTAVHNTVTVDGQDQMRRAGRFLWVDWAQASGRLYSSLNATTPNSFEGQHDGYRHLGVTHRRMVRWLRGHGWAIVDDIEGAGEHRACLHWLTADSPFEIALSPFQVAFDRCESKIRWNLFASVEGKGAVILAGKQRENVDPNPEILTAESQLLGWHSPTYADIQPATSLLYETHSLLPIRLVTIILTDERCHVESRDNVILVSMQESEVYRVNLSSGSQEPGAGN